MYPIYGVSQRELSGRCPLCKCYFVEATSPLFNKQLRESLSRLEIHLIITVYGPVNDRALVKRIFNRALFCANKDGLPIVFTT